MWQAPNQRVRALANAKKREREKSKRPLHIVRVNATMKVQPFHATGKVEEVQTDGAEAEPAKVRLILNDLTTKVASFFSRQSLVSGQEIILKIEEPQEIVLKAKITWCQEYAAGSPVLSNHPFSYRIGVAFIFDQPQEKEKLGTFCDGVYRTHLYPALKAA